MQLKYTIRPEITARRYFGELLKICQVVEFTFVVELVAIVRSITKWLIEHTLGI